MSSEVGDRALGALTEKGPKRKIANCLKSSTMSIKRAHFEKYRVPLGPAQEMKFLGPGGTGPLRFLRSCSLQDLSLSRLGPADAASRAESNPASRLW